MKRELKEEFGVELISHEFFGNFEDEAALDPGMRVRMNVYVVSIKGEPKASSEIEEFIYVDSSQSKIKLGSIPEKFVIPELKNKGMIN